MNYALAFPIPRTLADDWLALRVSDSEVAMSPLVGTGTVLFVQWFEGRFGYRWLLRLGASFRESHGVEAVVFKPWAREVRKVVADLGARHLTTDAEGEERWCLEGRGALRWLSIGTPIPELRLQTA